MDIIATAEACRSPIRSGMFERDGVVSHSTLNGARKRATHFTAFDTDSDRRSVPGDNYATRQGIGYSPVQGGGIAIAQRDIPGMGRCGCRDGLGSPGLVVASRRVIDAEGEGARMLNAQGEAAVGRDGSLGGGIGGGPHFGILGGGNVPPPPRCSIKLILSHGLPGRGCYLAGYGCGVCVGDCSGLGGWIALGGNGDGAYGGIEESLFPDGEGEGGGVGGDLCDGYGVCFSTHRADGGCSRIRGNGGEGGADAEFQGFSVRFTQLQDEAQGSFGAVGVSRIDSDSW